MRRDASAFPGRFARLIDPRFGPIREVEPIALPAGWPRDLHGARASVADSSRFSPWQSDDRAGGFAWGDKDAALYAAAGEAIERYCGNLVPAGLERASYEDLERAGRAAIDPEGLALFSARQYRTPGFPFVPFRRDLPIWWTRGRSLASGEPVAAPASLVWVTFFKNGPSRREPKTNATPYAGVAAGSSRECAELAALCELFERDALARAWYGGEPLARLDPPAELACRVAGDGLEIELLQFPSDFGLPVVGALVRERGPDLLALGAACRPRPEEAAAKAVAEALQLLLACRVLDEPSSAFMRQVAAGAPGLGLKPWRADRAYRLSYREDWRDVWDLLSHLQLYFDPELRLRLERQLAERLQGSPPRPLAALPPGPPDAAGLVALLAARGCEAVAVDLTTPEVAAQGLTVVRVLAPGLYGNAPAAFPYLGGPRLAAAAARGELCRLPLPYA